MTWSTLCLRGQTAIAGSAQAWPARPRPDVDQVGRQRVKKALRDTLTDEHGCWILADHTAADSELTLNHCRDGAPETAIIDRTFVVLECQ